MSTQFFQRQADARSNTTWLVVLFAIAVIGIVGVSGAIGYVAAESYVGTRDRSAPANDVNPAVVAVICGSVAAVVILVGSSYQIIALRAGGGSSVAESLGGRPLVSETADTEERRLLNVVEEMAIASGTPVPRVFLLEEQGINAFAAGYRPSDAVIGVTRGAISNLNREQLQGVIAHEFSHILNGDMRINIRMIGILHGILLMALVGRILLNSIRFVGNRSSRDSKGNGGVILFLIATGVTLLIIGWIGHLIGGLIKAATCRQREYLADASAVQFTRNPDGIGGALKRIGALSRHGRIEHRNAAIASHMFFSQAVFEGLSQLMATHPPLEKRIRAIDPRWDGSFEISSTSSSRPDVTMARPQVAARSQGTAGLMEFADTPQEANDLVSPTLVRDAVQHVGAPEKDHRDYSALLLNNMDYNLRRAAGDPCVARALVFCLLVDRKDDVAAKQFASLSKIVDANLLSMTKRLLPHVQCAPEALRLPLVDLALPALRQMSRPQYEHFAAAVDALIRADEQLSIFEWTLSQVVRRNLRSQFFPASEIRTQYYNLQKLTEPVSSLISMLARVGQQNEQDVLRAFSAATACLPEVRIVLLPIDQCSLSKLDQALGQLRRTSERVRGKLIDACAECVAADSVVKVRETELLRGIADLLECPMPPIITRRDKSPSPQSGED